MEECHQWGFHLEIAGNRDGISFSIYINIQYYITLRRQLLLSADSGEVHRVHDATPEVHYSRHEPWAAENALDLRRRRTGRHEHHPEVIVVYVVVLGPRGKGEGVINSEELQCDAMC